jgi:hypothetical protein
MNQTPVQSVLCTISTADKDDFKASLRLHHATIAGRAEWRLLRTTLAQRFGDSMSLEFSVPGRAAGGVASYDAI